MRSAIWFIVATLASCANHDPVGSDAAADRTLMFHGQQPAFPGFSYDTGAQPSGAAVTLDLAFSATGSITADAAATAGGTGSALAVAGVPGSGVYAIDAHLGAVAMLHVAVDGSPAYDGPIPAIDTLDIALAGTTQFDPFLIGGKAHLAMSLADAQLPAIPLDGVSGNLMITIASTSTAESDLGGVCAGLDANKVQFLAQSSTSATIVLKPTIVLTSSGGDVMTYPIPDVTISIPSSDASLDLGTLDAPQGGRTPSGASLASNASCAGVACKYEPQAGFSPTWVPPAALHQNRCTSTQLGAFATGCGPTTSISATCSTFLDDASNTDCAACILTPETSSSYGALIGSALGGQLNTGGCIASLDPTQLGVAKTWQATAQCEAAACSGCSGASDQAITACTYGADDGDCATYNGASQAKFPTGAAAACLDQATADMFGYYATLFCGQ